MLMASDALLDILNNVCIIVHNMLCCCHKYCVLLESWFHLISRAIVDDLVIIYLFSFY